MCPEDIFRNNEGYSHVLYCFFRQCVSALCTVSVVFFCFDFCLLLQIAHLPLNFCVPGDQVSPIGGSKESMESFNLRRDGKPSFMGRILGWEIMFFIFIFC